jgi:Family of unknown function (DUF6800)
MGRHDRKSEINRRRARRLKLQKLRRRYAAAKNDTERSKLVDKLRLVSPAMSREFFTAAPAQGAGKA